MTPGRVNLPNLKLSKIRDNSGGDKSPHEYQNLLVASSTTKHRQLTMFPSSSAINARKVPCEAVNAYNEQAFY